MRRISAIATLLALSATAGFAATAGGPAAPGYSIESAPALLATGDDQNVDGYLEVTMDEYGSWGNFEGVLNDLFNPAGPNSINLVAFSDGFYLTIPESNQRQLLSTIQSWLDVGPDDGSLTHTITGDNVATDMNGDGVDDAVMSSFEVTGTGVDLSVDHAAQVLSLGGGVAQILQSYTFTNNDGAPITFQLTRNYDGDLLYDGDFGSDEVGTTWNAAGGDVFVAMQEVGDPATAVTISGSADAYYGGKNGIQPGGLDPAYGFGTDVQIYEAFGIPDNWVNHIAGVGYDTDGFSDAQPAGCDLGNGCDAFIGLSYDVTIPAGGSEVVSIAHTYGSNTPGGGGGAGLMFNISGSCPGPMTVEVTGATPGATVGVGLSPNSGTFDLPSGPCAGTEMTLGLPLSAARFLTADGAGTVSFDADPGVANCGSSIQAVDFGTCDVSGVIPVP